MRIYSANIIKYSVLGVAHYHFVYFCRNYPTRKFNLLCIILCSTIHDCARIFRNYLINGTIFEKKYVYIWHEMCVLVFSTTFLCENFVVPGRIQGYIINVLRFVYFCAILTKTGVCVNILVRVLIQNCIKICCCCTVWLGWGRLFTCVTVKLGDHTCL